MELEMEQQQEKFKEQEKLQTKDLDDLAARELEPMETRLQQLRSRIAVLEGTRGA